MAFQKKILDSVRKDDTEAFQKALTEIGSTGLPMVLKDRLFLEAGIEGSLKCLRILLTMDVNLNVTNVDGDTALSLASGAGNEACVAALLEAGADVNKCKNGGWSPLMIAAAKGNKGCLRSLLRAGADIDAKTKEGLTALHWAGLKGHEECVRVLLSEGADWRAKDGSGQSAKDLARLSKWNDIADFLEGYERSKEENTLLSEDIPEALSGKQKNRL